MTKCSSEENLKRLAAWNAWKEVCWVHGLGKPCGDLPIIGTEEDETLLAKMIRNSFLRKLDPFKRQLGDSEGNIALLKDLDCAQEFDNALLEYKTADIPDKRFTDNGQIHLRQKKDWKEFVWDSLAVSEDHPLKVIYGKLLGPQGVINDIVEDWLFSNFSVRITGKMYEFLTSLDAKTFERVTDNGSDNDNFLENEAAKAISPDSYGVTADMDDTLCDGTQGTSSLEVSERTLTSWRAELEQAFSLRLCCLMIAHINGVKLYADTEVLKALGIGKTVAAAELNKARKCLSGLNPELRDWIMMDDAGTRFFKQWIEDRCKAERAGTLILSRIEEKRGKAQ